MLTDLTPGMSYGVAVIGKDVSGQWEGEPDATLSQVWEVLGPKGSLPATVPLPPAQPADAGSALSTSPKAGGPTISGSIARHGPFAELGPYHVTGDAVLEPGYTMTILPGTTVFFDAGAGLTVNGRLVAEGTARLIRLTRTRRRLLGRHPLPEHPGGQPHQLRHRRIWRRTLGNRRRQRHDRRDQLDAADRPRHLRPRPLPPHPHRQLLADRSRNSVFTDIFGPGEAPLTNNHSEQIWGNNAPNGGWILIENNVFGTTKGHNDIIDVNGGHRAAGDPVPRILDNIFLGGGDEALDIEGDFFIEGNTFTHFHKDHSTSRPRRARPTSSPPATPPTCGYDYVVVRNVFYDVDHAVLIKDNSTLDVRQQHRHRRHGRQAGHLLRGGRRFGRRRPTRAYHRRQHLQQRADPLRPDGRRRPTPTLTINRSVIAAPGTATAWATPPKTRGWPIRPAAISACSRLAALGTGPNGLDMGA